MKNVDGIFVNNIIHDFKRIGIPVESDNKMFVIGFFLVNRGVISSGRNRKANVFFGYTVNERCLIEFYVKIHVLSVLLFWAN
jgi:hypothetical protein